MHLIDVAALELGRLELDDALRYVAVLATHDDRRFDAAAARLAARIVYEQRLGTHHAHAVLALCAALPAAPEAITALLQRWIEPPARRSAAGAEAAQHDAR